MCKDSFMKRCAILVVCAIQRWARYLTTRYLYKNKAVELPMRCIASYEGVQLYICV
jgi:hypothetical protein